ncbi:MAG: helix-turn-helix domain-containing protein [Planctomycetes bacterium]|nr:helix-turn-helix domain-containing protein [Planctomycetota bacterium]
MKNAAGGPDLKLTQVAKVTGMSASALRVLAAQGKLPGVYRLGGMWRMRREYLDKIRTPNAEIALARASA